jgi:hypothetical protein
MSTEWIVLAPLLIGVTVVLLCFVGCTFTVPGIAPLTYFQIVSAEPDLVSYWPLEEETCPAGPAGCAKDYKGPNSGDYVGNYGLGQVVGWVFSGGQSTVKLDGSTAWVRTPLKPDFPQGTIEFWGFLEDRSVPRCACVYRDLPDSQGPPSQYTFEVGVLTNGAPQAYVWDVGAATALFATPSPFGPDQAIPIHDWSYYALTWGGGQTLTLYAGGLFKNQLFAYHSQATINTVETALTNGQFVLGQAGGPASNLTSPWKGGLAEFAIYDMALPAATLQSHYALNLP